MTVSAECLLAAFRREGYRLSPQKAGRVTVFRPNATVAEGVVDPLGSRPWHPFFPSRRTRALVRSYLRASAPNPSTSADPLRVGE